MDALLNKESADAFESHFLFDNKVYAIDDDESELAVVPEKSKETNGAASTTNSASNEFGEFESKQQNQKKY